jgi:hypothetical protein
LPPIAKGLFGGETLPETFAHRFAPPGVSIAAQRPKTRRRVDYRPNPQATWAKLEKFFQRENGMHGGNAGSGDVKYPNRPA